MTCKLKGWSDCAARLMPGGRRGAAAAQLQLSLLNHQSHRAAAVVAFEGNKHRAAFSHPVKAVKLKPNHFHRVPSLQW